MNSDKQNNFLVIMQSERNLTFLAKQKQKKRVLKGNFLSHSAPVISLLKK